MSNKPLDWAGIGKSEVIKRYADENGLKVIDIKITEEKLLDDDAHRCGYDDAINHYSPKSENKYYLRGYKSGLEVRIAWAQENLDSFEERYEEIDL